ncbi:unnamed protein product [Ilex paraguariensis]|uniref:Uncharacterized protein n=1 Tax=Ilex paraguariensis TaxID=185542 RepID=A0ABC8S4B4_9AQUA
MANLTSYTPGLNINLVKTEVKGYPPVQEVIYETQVLKILFLNISSSIVMELSNRSQFEMPIGLYKIGTCQIIMEKDNGDLMLYSGWG